MIEVQIIHQIDLHMLCTNPNLIYLFPIKFYPEILRQRERVTTDRCCKVEEEVSVEVTHNREGLQYNECPRSPRQTFIKTSALTSVGDLHLYLPSPKPPLPPTSNQSRIISGAQSWTKLSCISSTSVSYFLSIRVLLLQLLLSIVSPYFMIIFELPGLQLLITMTPPVH